MPAATPRLRRHQSEALAALDKAWANGDDRAWVVLPPGAGKTLVGLESARRMLAEGEVERVVVLGPNTAIQGQWLAEARTVGLTAGDSRSLTEPLTALTYQAVAVFDPDAEVTDDAEEQSLLARLHVNGRLLVKQLRAAGRILLVLDECHHLLEVWGRLLAELLDGLPQARVLGLTATPPDALTADQAELVSALFGRVTSSASIPAVVKEGDLAPFAELAWLTSPTPEEEQWLAGEAERFATLVTRLTDPNFGSVSFLRWLDRRFVEPAGRQLTWLELLGRWPDEGAAALRLYHVGLLRLPDGARPTEAHRRPPTADDWVRLLDDWLLGHVADSDDPRDLEVLEEVGHALPAVGYLLTRRGVRRGRSPVDRVLARSAAKADACVEIVDHEHRTLTDRLRMLVLCDHERASATVPVGLEGVLDAQAGSAYAVVERLVADPATTGLQPLLVTGRVVAAAPETLHTLREYVATRDPWLAERLLVEPEGDGLAALTGPWNSRDWVPLVTRFFEDGHARVLIGTRALLGEGWDARRVTGLVDLTTVTTSTAVVQTRGRALRVDPTWPEKVAVTWTVTCVTDRHPKGDNDWQRLVRKHGGYYAVDHDGDLVDGVGHLDPLFSPYAPPGEALLGQFNARAALRAEERATIADQWRVGEPYQDTAARTIRVLPREPERLGPGAEPARVVVTPDGPADRAGAAPAARELVPWYLAALAGAGAALVAFWGSWPVAGALLAACLLLGVVGTARFGSRVEGYGRRVLTEAARPPGLVQVASAVADALVETGLADTGAADVRVELDADGEYRVRLAGVDEATSELFTGAVDEALAPVDATVRYLVPRWTVTADPTDRRRCYAAAFGDVRPDGVVWHPVPAALGVNKRRAWAYAAALDRWVGGGDPVYTGSPEGAGILAAQQGSDPFDVTTVMRRQWT